MEPTTSLPLIETGTGGCSCCAPSPTDQTSSTTTTATRGKGTDMTIQTYSVTGMTCGHCEHAVTTELKAIDGVTDVDVQLVPGGSSTVTVTSNQALSESQVTAALDEAGDYALAK